MNHICPGNEVSGAGLLRIIAVLSMRCFGYCEQEHPGVTCLPITGSGAVFIRGSSAGVEYEWLMINASHIKVHPHAAGASFADPV